MTDAQMIALVTCATDIILRNLAPAGAINAPREESIRRQLSHAVQLLAEKRIAPLSEEELEAHTFSAARQWKILDNA